MKRKFLLAAAFVFMAMAITSCEDLEQCKYCKIVSTDSSTGDVNEGFETEYCGASLLVIEATGPKTVGTVTTEYVCR
jgi:hypothetical protein